MAASGFRKHLYEMSVSTDLTKPEYDKIVVWAQTLQHFVDKPDGESILYREKIPPVNTKSLYQNRKPEVWNMDCIYAVEKILAEGYNPLLLNMADWEIAGGCVDTGSAAQEEELFRRSNYHKLLLQSYYPLDTYDTIYTPDVEFFRKGAKDGYVLMEKPIRIACVGAPALRFPQIDRRTGRYYDSKDVATMLLKIRTLFSVAHKHNHDSLVLSAWGCGAFGCPPTHTAELFKQVCDEVGGQFKRIVFAVLGPNYRPFEDVLAGRTPGVTEQGDSGR